MGEFVGTRIMSAALNGVCVKPPCRIKYIYLKGNKTEKSGKSVALI